MTRDELNELSNVALVQYAKDVHGALYARIWRLQRDLNLANAEAGALRAKLADKDARRITKQDALDAFGKLLDGFYEQRGQ